MRGGRVCVVGALALMGLLAASVHARKKMSKKEKSQKLDLALDPPLGYDECIRVMGGEDLATSYNPGPDIECAQCLTGCEPICKGNDRDACFACVRPGCDQPCVMLNTPTGRPGGLLHHLCKWWTDGGSSVLCNRMANEVQCRRFGRLHGEDRAIVLDPYLNQTKIKQFHSVCEDDIDDPVCMTQETVADYYRIVPSKTKPVSEKNEFIPEDIEGAVQLVEGAFDKEWAELSAAEFQAANLLGYTKTSWYEPAPPKLVAWDDLKAEERVSAALIGWDEELWTNELQVAGGPVEQQAEESDEAQVVEGVFDKEWEQLSKAELKAAKKIGYTKASWYESVPPKDVPYGALSSAEKKAAESLGWEEELWENERKAAAEESGGSDGEQTQYEDDDELVEVEGAFDKEWNALSKSEAKAAKRLGYTAISWYDNAPPKLIPWKKLSKGQVKAATKLGWDEELWENELETATKGEL